MTSVEASSGGRRITLDPVMETPTEVTLPRVRVENPIPAGFRVDWISGSDDEIEFNVTSGAGVGSPYLVLTVKDKATDVVLAYEIVDLRELLPVWLAAVRADGPTPEGAQASPCAGIEHDFPDDWNYRYDPAGSKTCRRCGHTIHD